MKSKVYKSKWDPVSEILNFLAKLVIVTYIFIAIVTFIEMVDYEVTFLGIVTFGATIVKGIVIGVLLMVISNALQYLKDIRDVKVDDYVQRQFHAQSNTKE